MAREFVNFDTYKRNRKIKEEIDELELRKSELDAQAEYIRQSNSEENGESQDNSTKKKKK